MDRNDFLKLLLGFGAWVVSSVAAALTATTLFLDKIAGFRFENLPNGEEKADENVILGGRTILYKNDQNQKTFAQKFIKTHSYLRLQNANSKSYQK